MHSSDSAMCHTNTHKRDCEEIFEILVSNANANAVPNQKKMAFSIECRWRWACSDARVPCLFEHAAEKNPLRKSRWLCLEDAVTQVGRRSNEMRHVCCEMRSLNGGTSLSREFATPSHAIAVFSDLLKCQRWRNTHHRTQDTSAQGFVPMWNANNSHDLGPTLPSDVPAIVIDHSVLATVTGAVDALNSGRVMCNEGYCIVYSQRQGSYFLIWRSDAKKEAFETFALDLDEDFERKDFEDTLHSILTNPFC